MIDLHACMHASAGTMIALQYIACIFHIIACVSGINEVHQAAQIIDCIADIVWCRWVSVEVVGGCASAGGSGSGSASQAWNLMLPLFSSPSTRMHLQRVRLHADAAQDRAG